MSDLEDRLQAWFADEVDRAARDLASSKVGTARVRRRRPLPGLAVAALTVALVVTVLAVRPGVTPDTGKGPHRSPASLPAASGGLVAFGADGLPTIIDGETVLRVEEARDQLLASGRNLLVAGWYAPSFQRCGFTRGHPLLQSCGNAWLVPNKGEKAGVGLELEETPGGIEIGAVVLRLHTRDPRAETCEEAQRLRCQAAIVADEVAWPRTYANGIPRKVDGEAVLLVGDAYRRLTDSDEPQQLVIGGWYSDDPMPCPSVPGEPVSPLLPRCSGAQLSEGPGPREGKLDVVPDGTNIPRGRVVLRVHTSDPRASSCPKADTQFCERAIVVDEVMWSEPVAPMAGRFPDGIPMTIDGEPVVRAGDARGVADDRTDASSFLVGGWYVGPQPVSCPAPIDQHPLAWSCGPARLGERPGTGALVLGPGPEIAEGPVVVAAHVNDGTASGCLPENRARCEMTIVVDRVVWAGDEATITEPLRIDDVVTALRRDISGFTVEVAAIDRGGCDPGWPQVSWVAVSTTAVGDVLVFPTTAAREAVDENFGWTGWTGPGGCIVESDDGGSWRWVSVRNVMVSTSEALSERTRMRLEAIAP